EKTQKDALLHVSYAGGNHNAKRHGCKHEKKGGTREQEQIPFDRNTIKEVASSFQDSQRKKANPDIGDHFSEQDFRDRERGSQELLEGAAFAFSHEPYGCYH